MMLRGLGLAGVLTAALGAAALAFTGLPRLTEGTAAPRATTNAAANPVVLDAPPAQVAVVDAGTLRLQDHVVRLLGVDPPTRGATCRSHDGTGFDCAAAATNAVAALIREAPVACRLRGQDDFGRPYAVCRTSGTDLNRAVIAAGWARADRTQPELRQDEESARTQGRGLWAARDPIW
jgi:endonuclease YncB( thermonuclease family)